MKAKLAVMLLCMIILSAPDGQSSPAKGESKSETWTVAEKLFETAIGVEFLNMPEDHSNKLDGFISMLSQEDLPSSCP